MLQSVAPPLIEIPPLTDSELQQVAAEPNHIGLEELLHNGSLKEVLRVPMYLSYVCSSELNEAVNAVEYLDVHGLEELLRATVIRNEKQRRAGIHLRRERCFTNIAVNRARTMTPFVPPDSFDAAALQTLEADDLVIRREEGIAPAHDLFEEWAINRYVSSVMKAPPNILEHPRGEAAILNTSLFSASGCHFYRRFPFPLLVAVSQLPRLCDTCPVDRYGIAFKMIHKEARRRRRRRTQ